MDERMEKQLAFSLEIDKVKNIFRQLIPRRNPIFYRKALQKWWKQAVMQSLWRFLLKG